MRHSQIKCLLSIATSLGVAGLLAFFVATTAAQAVSDTTMTPKEHQRTVDQTFLTFPEWFLVFSPDEYANYLKDQRPSGFPFFGHIGQFWDSYRAVTAETVAQKYECNPGYHLMVMVIGVSTTVEYAVKSAYENTIGRLFEGWSYEQTAEDQFAAKYAQDYVRFIRDLPWYQYDFVAQLKTLWADVPKTGEHLLRKWERRFALSTELIAKASYGKLLGVATGSIYDQPLMVTAIVTRSAAPSSTTAAQTLKSVINDKFPDIKLLAEAQGNDAKDAKATIPRYERFTHYSNYLAQANIDFIEIAGNKSIILVSMIGPSQWAPTLTEKILIEQPILTVAGRKRVVATVSVKSLAIALRAWAKQQVEVEHIFDY